MERCKEKDAQPALIPLTDPPCIFVSLDVLLTIARSLAGRFLIHEFLGTFISSFAFSAIGLLLSFQFSAVFSASFLVFTAASYPTLFCILFHLETRIGSVFQHSSIGKLASAYVLGESFVGLAGYSAPERYTVCLRVVGTRLHKQLDPAADLAPT